jgi:hypothetical protein
MIEQLVWAAVCGTVVVLFMSVLAYWNIITAEFVSSPTLLWLFGTLLVGTDALLANWIYKCKDLRVTIIAMAILVPLVLVLLTLH